MKKISVVLIAFLVGTIFVSCLRTTQSSSDGTTWIKYSGNPLNLGLENPSWPWVVYDGRMFKMWYTGVTVPRTEKIYFADSPNGVDWALHGIVLDKGEAGSWDDEFVCHAAVLFDGSTYRMWYIGHGESAGYDMVGYATSSDGIIWVRPEANPVLVPGGNGGWDDWNIAGISVIFNGTQYIMWYSAQATYAANVGMGVATSFDGVSWTKYSGNPVMVGGPNGWDSAHVWAGPVITNDSHYKMWYAGQPRDYPGSIGLATSPDGFSWSKYSENPVLEPGSPGSWDSATILSPCVVEKDDNLLMWYYGEGMGTRGIGLATSYSPCIVAEVDIDPDTLNLRSQGKWITAYVELPEGYSVANIDAFSIMLNDTIPVDPSAPKTIGDYDNDGVLDLMVKFDRAQVSQYILDHVSMTEQFMRVTLTVTGKLNDGMLFRGSDTITAVVPMQKGRQGIYPK